MSKLVPNRLIPRENESLMSLLYALTRRNHYASPYWLLDQVAGGRKRDQLRLNAAARPHQLATASEVSGLPIETIYGMTLNRFAAHLQDPKSLVFEDSRNYLNGASRLAFRPRHIRFCPLCIQNELHHKIIWDLPYLSICLKHDVMLSDCCPRCKKPVTFGDLESGNHSCGQDLTEGSKDLPDDLQVLEAQQFIASCFGLNDSFFASSPQSPLFALPSHILFSLLDCLIGILVTCSSSSDASFSMERPRAWRYSASIAQMYELVGEAYRIFTNWPENFFGFLDDFRKRGGDTYFSGLSREYRPLLRLMVASRRSYPFVFEGFKEYLSRRWTGGLVRNSSKFFEPGELERRRYIGLQEAAALLGASYSVAQGLMREKTIRTKKRKIDRKQIILVERGSVDELLAQWRDCLTINQAAEELRVSVRGLRDLMHAGYVVSRHITKKFRLVDRGSIAALIEECVADSPPLPISGETTWIDYAETAQILSGKPHLVSTLIGAMKMGILRGYKDKYESGLGALRFLRSDVETAKSLAFAQGPVYVSPSLPADKKGLTSLRRVTKYLGLNRQTIIGLYAKKLLMGDLGYGSDGRRIYKIDVASLLQFESNYLRLDQVLSRLNMKKKRFFGLISRGVLSGCINVDGSWFVPTSELDRLAPENMLSFTDAGQRLGVSHRYIHALASCGLLSAYKVSARNRLPLILKADVEKLSKRMAIVHSDPDTLKTVLGINKADSSELARRGLNCLREDPRRAEEFDDVEIEMLHQSINRSALPEIFGCSRDAVTKWIDAGLLKPEPDDKNSQERYSVAHVVTFLGIRETLAGNRINIKYQTFEGSSKSQGIAGLAGVTDPCILEQRELARSALRQKTGILSAKEAAALLGSPVHHFYKVWVKTGRLKPVPAVAKSNRYVFSKEEVERLATVRRGALTVDQVARALSLANNTIRKWVRAGRLTPISGPSIDGAAKYLFSHDVIATMGRA